MADIESKTTESTNNARFNFDVGKVIAAIALLLLVLGLLKWAGVSPI